MQMRAFGSLVVCRYTFLLVFFSLPPPPFSCVNFVKKQAKKREKKKNAAKESAVEPPSKESKAGGGGGNGGGGGKNAPGVAKRANGKKDKTADGNDDENEADTRSSVQPSQGLGKKVGVSFFVCACVLLCLVCSPKLPDVVCCC